MGTKLTHTPGPWKIGNFSSVVISQLTRDTPSKYNDSNSYYGGNLIAESMKEADARLIAAAPDLLESCIQLLRHAEILINSNHPDWIAAHDAIAKATGVNPDPINPYISNRGF